MSSDSARCDHELMWLWFSNFQCVTLWRPEAETQGLAIVHSQSVQPCQLFREIHWSLHGFSLGLLQAEELERELRQLRCAHHQPAKDTHVRFQP